jgi:hypothetical protein
VSNYGRNGARNAGRSGDSSERLGFGCPQAYFLDDLRVMGPESEWCKFVLSSLLRNSATNPAEYAHFLDPRRVRLSQG